ncbi:MAG TPA: drug/metabolite exporter YedA [Gammaproteobacteria bacterium]
MDAALKLRIALALAAVYIIWGSTYLAIRYSLTDFPPFIMAGSRFVIAGLALGIFAMLRGNALPTFAQWRNSFFLGFLLFVVGNGGVVFAEQWIASSLAATAVASMPIFATVFGYFFGRELTRLDLVAVFVGFAGVAILNHDAGMGSILHPAALALIAAPLCWAFGSVASRSMNLPKGLMMSAAQMLGGGVLLMAVSFALGERWPDEIGNAALAAWLYQIVFGSLIAFSAYLFLLQNVRPALATSYAFVNPPLAVLFGVWLANESVSGWGYAGMAVIVSAVVLIQAQRTTGRGQKTST